MIPAWDMAGVIPPIQPGLPGHSPDRSPYQAQLSEVVDDFSLSNDRMEILDGLLKFRAALHAIGITQGFQWLDGSFMENIEVIDNRSPRDIDVVTYFALPPGETQASLAAQHPLLFDHPHLKNTYHVDAYFSVLGQPLAARSVKTISYWYSMWSHRRDGVWKGFLQVDLSPAEDIAAGALLQSKLSGAGLTI